MGLQKQQLFLSAQDGLDTKTDDKNSIETRFTELENVRFTSTGRLQKRPGNDALTTTRISGGSISDANTLTTYRGTELVEIGASSFDAYVSANSTWAQRDSKRWYTSSDRYVATRPYTSTYGTLQSNIHSAINGSYTCYVYDTIDNVNRYYVMDTTTQNIIASGTTGASNGDCQVFAVGTYFVILYTTGGSSYMKSISTSTPATISSATLVVAESIFPLVGFTGTDGNLYCMYHNNRLATDVKKFYISSALAISSATTIGSAETIGATEYGAHLAINQEGSNYRFSYAVQSGTIKSILYSSAFGSTVHSLTSITSLTAPAGVAAVAATSSSSMIIYEARPSSTSRVLNYVLISSAGSASAEALFKQACTLESKGINVPAGSASNGYVVVSPFDFASSALNRWNTFFAIDLSGSVVGRFAPDNGYTYSTAISSNGRFGSLNVINSSSFFFTGTELAEIATPGVAPTVPVIVKDFIVSFVSSKIPNVELGSNLILAGSIGKMYDGSVVVEQGFLQNPKPIYGITIANGGSIGNPSIGGDQYYSWAYLYRWTDAKGNQHRSAPYYTASTFVSTGYVGKKATMNIPYLNFTDKIDVRVSLYRTQANGSIFNLVADVAINASTLESFSYVDTAADATVAANEVLYTTSGELETDPLTDAKSLTVYQDRVFALNGSGTLLSYSKQNQTGAPVEFSAALQQTVPQKGGTATAIAAMDSAFLIFKQTSIFTFSGNGPNDLGEQSDYGIPQEITVDAGCSEPASIVKTPLGIIFKSAKGIYILKRNFSVEYIGAPVEAYNSLTITSATLLDNTTEVHFTTNSSRILVYDYYHNRWTTDTGITAVDSCELGQKRYVTTSAGQVYKENQTSFADGSSFIPVKITTAWVKLNSLQSFKRFYELMLLGSYKSAHNLKVSLAYDYNNTYTHSVTFTPGPTDPYQYRINPQVQKCEAFKVKIEDLYTSTNGESFNLSNIAVEVGMKTGLDKIPSGRYKGVS